MSQWTFVESKGGFQIEIKTKISKLIVYSLGAIHKRHHQFFEIFDPPPFIDDVFYERP